MSKQFLAIPFFIIFVSAIIIFPSCRRQGAPERRIAEQDQNGLSIPVPEFDEDSAFAFIEKQVAFGYRVPNTPAHRQTAAWLAETLGRFTDTLIVQHARVRASNGDVLAIQNIIGSFDVGNPRRVLLVAHWDTRPWADHDPDPANHWRPFAGANDGGSGTAVLLEIARQIAMAEQRPQVGIDIILFDAEDYGEHHSVSGRVEDSWGLGSQHWARNPHIRGYTALYGINLCMVGAYDARFLHEGFSKRYAAGVIRKVWQLAHQLGYGEFFPNKEGGFIINDHYYVNTILNIPTINVIHQERNGTHGFFRYWHTMKDDLPIISKPVLRAVGQTVLATVYAE
ncbi:MAG TPA: glutamine cyclotransferase [Bacteroidales bacterium]|nr:glutamine cyclotransferase [Bacteroidales bacterium]